MKLFIQLISVVIFSNIFSSTQARVCEDTVRDIQRKTDASIIRSRPFQKKYFTHKPWGYSFSEVFETPEGTRKFALKIIGGAAVLAGAATAFGTLVMHKDFATVSSYVGWGAISLSAPAIIMGGMTGMAIYEDYAKLQEAFDHYNPVTPFESESEIDIAHQHFLRAVDQIELPAKWYFWAREIAGPLRREQAKQEFYANQMRVMREHP